MKRRRKDRGQTSDERALAKVRDAGWSLIRSREAGDVRYVARKQITEEDDSVTSLFESDYTVEGLARAVIRREREEAPRMGATA
jgi:hypothetical protein